MTERSDTAGGVLASLYYLSVLGALVVMLLASVPSVANPVARVSLLALLGLLVVATVVGLWRRNTGQTGTHAGTVEDITYDPFSHPGDAARHSWRKANRRLRRRDDDENE